MSVLEKALGMLKKYPLCDHCLGRQFALLGYGVENDERGKSIKVTLALEAQTLTLSEGTEGVKILKTLAINGFSDTARSVLRKMKKRIPSKTLPTSCFLCEGKFENLDNLLKKAMGNVKP